MILQVIRNVDEILWIIAMGNALNVKMFKHCRVTLQSRLPPPLTYDTAIRLPKSVKGKEREEKIADA